RSSVESRRRNIFAKVRTASRRSGQTVAVISVRRASSTDGGAATGAAVGGGGAGVSAAGSDTFGAPRSVSRAVPFVVEPVPPPIVRAGPGRSRDTAAIRRGSPPPPRPHGRSGRTGA